jgi:hypothetical protein
MTELQTHGLRPGGVARSTRIGFRVGALFFLLGVGGAATAAAQDAGPAEGQVCGRVIHAEHGQPLSNVVVRAAGGERGVLTRADGGFCLPFPGEGRLVAERVGLSPLTREIAVRAVGTLRVELRMADRALELPGIEVTAREARGQREGSTVSRIERAAVEHLQAASLGDVLQLLPGQVSRNPDLGSAQQSLLRQVPTTVEAARANALGTAVVVDGAPISNNANL